MSWAELAGYADRVLGPNEWALLVGTDPVDGTRFVTVMLTGGRRPLLRYDGEGSTTEYAVRDCCAELRRDVCPTIPATPPREREDDSTLEPLLQASLAVARGARR